MISYQERGYLGKKWTEWDEKGTKCPFSTNKTVFCLTDAPVFLPESKCTLIRDGIQCECIASANPEPAIQFHLPDLNITINETESQFNYYSHTDGYMTTSMIKLKEKPSSGLHVLCTISNMYGTETVKLELQQESMCFLDLSLCMGGIVGQGGQTQLLEGAVKKTLKSIKHVQLNKQLDQLN